MPRVSKPLSDTTIRASKPGEKSYKLSDGNGLQLWVMPTGSRLWRLDFRLDGKRRSYSIGAYPAIALREARERAADARKQIRDGVDPVKARKPTKAPAIDTFWTIAEELLAKKEREGRASATVAKTRWLLTLVREALGARPVREITPQDVLAAIRPAESAGHYETAVRLRGRIGEVFRFAIATGRADLDPTGALRGALTRPKVKHRAAILSETEFGGLLRAIDGYQGSPIVRMGLQLLALTFVRPGELRAGEWSDIDLEEAIWTIPAEKMKMRRPHRIPLSRQAVAVFGALKSLTGAGRYCLPNERTLGRPLSENAFNAALRRMGFTKEEVCGHGFRASASSILNETRLWSPDAIERQLAHADNDSVRKAYHRAEYWDERVRMMQWWADRLDALRQQKNSGSSYSQA